MSRRKVGQATIEALMGDIRTEEKHNIGCCICDEQEETESESAHSFAECLYKKGWRYLSSDKFQVLGAMCPRCAALPDRDRGEWETT